MENKELEELIESCDDLPLKIWHICEEHSITQVVSAMLLILLDAASQIEDPAARTDLALSIIRLLKSELIPNN